MKKEELLKVVKAQVEDLDNCLKAAGIPTDLADYSDEQVKTVQGLFESRKAAKAKSFPEVVAQQAAKPTDKPAGRNAIAVAPGKTIAQPTIGDIPQDAADPLRSLVGERTQEGVTSLVDGIVDGVHEKTEPERSYVEGKQIGENLVIAERNKVITADFVKERIELGKQRHRKPNP